MPKRFEEEGDDRLMNSLISSYAVEGNTDGKGNGKFFLTKNALRNVSDEVVGTHLGYTGKKKEKFINAKFNDLMENFDVNDDGFLTVDRVPQFLRMLLGENEVAAGLQVQTHSKSH